MSLYDLFEILFKYRPLHGTMPDTGFIERLNLYLKPLIATSFYGRKQLILSAGQVAEYIYFVETGIARGFHIHHETKKEITSFLWNKHSIVTVPHSFYQRQPSALFIEVMPGTQLMGISYQELMACASEYPEVEVFSRNVILQYSAHEARRNHELMSMSAWERYLQLLETNPNIEQVVSKEVIASYLNVTPQSLSRMLKKRRHP